ncbi:PBSX family phage terminase large subunit [Niallia circulans]|uniref:PBSX family phage terminase large subunit n=1 Tax=Niallia circulans TaxID=1397 RepID=UPI00352569D0
MVATQPKKTVKEFSFLIRAPKKKKPAPFKFKPFSIKQKQVLTWWRKDSPMKDKDGIICDGSVRAGKTVVMSLSFVMWAMDTFHECNLGMSGKTIGSFRRNVITPLKRMLKARGYKVKDHRADNFMTITYKGKTNYFYIFGGKDEGSQDLIQGITLAGMFFDEVALMPQSFVNQATARCSVDGAKFWFNCNPAGPFHWFKVEYLDQLKEKNMVHIHFTMDDNLSLTPKTKERYKRMYKGIFYKRFILGLWVLAEGIIFDMFDKEKHVVATETRKYSKYYVSIDYGTQNPTTFGLWGLCGDVWYKTKEYHYDGRKKSKQKTDQEYLEDLKAFVADISNFRGVIVDPSAASFIALLKKNGFKVIKAKNDVLDGIRNMASALNNLMIKYNDCCKETFREFSSYIWDEKAADRGEDKPVKQNDHQMDGDRYFVNTILFNRNKLSTMDKKSFGL